MKRILCVMLALASGLSALALVSCAKSETALPSKPAASVKSQTPAAPTHARTRVLVYFTRCEYPGVGARDVEGPGSEQALAILVESPAPGESVTSPVKVSGSANVFEAQLTVEITDSDGVIVATRSIMASSGTGTRGDFSAEIPFTVGRSGLGEVVFSSISPKDGKRINVVEIPVRMTE